MNQIKMDRLQILEMLEVGKQRIERKHRQTMGIGHKNNQKKIDIKHQTVENKVDIGDLTMDYHKIVDRK